jgi:4-amino-4-deoxy-L-arabinose transferase-like glycosyltransferase
MKSRFLILFSLTSFAVYLGVFIYICQAHILYPGFTEPMEGDVLQHIERISNALVPYPKPGGDFIAIAHMPLYYFLSVPFYLLFGDSFAGPRMLSSLCAIASGFLVARIGWKESKSWIIGLLAGAFYFSSYRIMDAVLTCSLPDSLMLLLLLLGFYFFAYGSERVHDVLWLLFFSLAFWTKQHGAIYFGFVVLYALLFRRNFIPKWGIILGILLGGPCSYLIVGSFLGEGFFYHTFTVPGLWGRKFWISVERTAFSLVCFVPFSILLALSYLRESVHLKRLKLTP